MTWSIWLRPLMYGLRPYIQQCAKNDRVQSCRELMEKEYAACINKFKFLLLKFGYVFKVFLAEKLEIYIGLIRRFSWVQNCIAYICPFLATSLFSSAYSVKIQPFFVFKGMHGYPKTYFLFCKTMIADQV